MKTCDHLKTLIRAQLQDDIQRTGDFDVGYLQNSTVVSLRSPEDIQEIWSSMIKGTKVTLWCDGLRSRAVTGTKSRKRRPKDDSSDESDVDCLEKPKKKTKEEEKDDRVQKIIEDLQTKYDKTYTPMQYRIWNEMIVGGISKGMEDIPTNPLFLRAGGTYPKKKNLHLIILFVSAIC